MIPDYSAVDVETGQLKYFEAKGSETDVWRIKRRLWKYFGDASLAVYKGNYRKIFLNEEIVPKVTNKCPTCGQNVWESKS